MLPADTARMTPLARTAKILCVADRDVINGARMTLTGATRVSNGVRLDATGERGTISNVRVAKGATGTTGVPFPIVFAALWTPLGGGSGNSQIFGMCPKTTDVSPFSTFQLFYDYSVSQYKMSLNENGVFVASLALSASLVTGKPTVVLGVLESGNRQLWVDGVSSATDATTWLGNHAWAYVGSTYGYGHQVANDRNTAGIVHGGVAFSRRRLDASIRALMRPEGFWPALFDERLTPRAPLYSAVDETRPSQSDHVRLAAGGAAYRARLGSLSTPGAGRVRVEADAAWSP